MDPVQSLIENIERAVLGKREEVVLAVVGLLAEGHVLLEDTPGTGKTTMARALARSIDLNFRRIQFTADLLPSDVVGVSILNAEAGRFQFQPGPVFGNVVLADELNRAPPRAQSALLECMTERQVTVDGTSHDLPRPFFVIATQNPLEYEGTYPLPESQLDRFMIKTSIGYPSREDERRVLMEHPDGRPLDDLRPVLSATDLLRIIDQIRAVRVDPRLVEYVLDLVAGTRESEALIVGASTRGALALQRAARAMARIEGRDYCVPDDVKRLFIPVLGHRIVLREGDAGDARSSEVLTALVEEVSVP